MEDTRQGVGLSSTEDEINDPSSKLGYLQLNPNPFENLSLSSNLTNQTFENSTATGGRDEFIAKIEQYVLIIIFILTILGNCLVLIGIYMRKQKMSRMYYFILHLSLADLTTAFFQVLTQLAWEITYRFQGGPFWCKFVKYTQILGPYSSSYILVMTALDRYQALCFPLSNCSWTARRSKIMLGTAWILAFACCLPQLYIFSYQEVAAGSGVFDCWATFAPGWGEKAYITWYCISVFIIPLIILIFAYSCITRVIWLNFSMKNAMMQENPSVRVREDSDELDEHEQDHGNGHQKNGQKLERNMSGKDSCRPKNVEVSWHQKSKSGPTTSITSHGSSIRNKSFSKASNNSGHAQESNNDTNPSYLPPLQAATVKESDSQFTPHDPTDFPESVNEDLEDFSELSPMNKPNAGLQKLSSSDRPRTILRSTSSTSNQDSGIHLCDGRSPAGSERRKRSTKLSLLVPSVNGKGHKHPKLRTQGSKAFSVRSSVSQPRTHSVKGISRAKIKTVKLTVTVICCYIICSTPFIAALLWSAYDPYAKEHPFFYGPTFAVLTLLASLNSCANAWIVLWFNPNLLQSFIRCKIFRICKRSEPSTLSPSQRQQLNNGRKFLGYSENHRPATSITRLSPLMNRLSQKEYGQNRSKVEKDTIELISPSTGTKKVNTETKPAFLSSRHESNYHNKDNTAPVETTSFISI